MVVRKSTYTPLYFCILRDPLLFLEVKKRGVSRTARERLTAVY